MTLVAAFDSSSGSRSRRRKEQQQQHERNNNDNNNCGGGCNSAGSNTAQEEEEEDDDVSAAQVDVKRSEGDEDDDEIDGHVRDLEKAFPPADGPIKTPGGGDCGGDDAAADGDDYSARSNDSAPSFSSGVRGFCLSWSSNAKCVTCLILILGCATSAAFLALGISFAREEKEVQFDRSTADLVNRIESQFEEYVHAASIVHNRCRNRRFSRRDFRQLYEYLIDGGLQFKAVQFDPNVTREERPAYEAEAAAYYAEHYPHVNYRGFVGFETEIPSGLEPRSEQDFYFPIHYMEPIPGNEAAIDLDYFSHISRRQTLNYCFRYGEPALTDRLTLVKTEDSVSRCGGNGPSYGVVLMHPGVNVTTHTDVWPRDLASIVICVPDLLRRATVNQLLAVDVYIHDSSDSSGETLFLGGLHVGGAMLNGGEDDVADFTFLEEIDVGDIRYHHTRHHHRGMTLFKQERVMLTNKIWTISVVGVDPAYGADLTFVILGGIFVFCAAGCLALWVYVSQRRMTQISALKQQSDSEKAALILQNAREATRAERELNDFIAHEVRNPVAAAMAACSFVKTEVNKNSPLADEQSRTTTRSDVDIIQNSLVFCHDLLRSMLDMHRAANKQILVNKALTDTLHDVLEPVAGMLHIQKQGGSKVEVIVDCPSDLFVVTDRLRLKQVILNLGRNSSKFISEGFIRLRGAVVNGRVQLSVEDSGSGIPLAKRQRMFNKYQESLDLLSQGTGIGLFLCKNLVEILGGHIYLDDDYDSGIPDCPGSRFVVDLKVPPQKPPPPPPEQQDSSSATALPSTANSSDNNGRYSKPNSSSPGANNNGVAGIGSTAQAEHNLDDKEEHDEFELPEKLSVLFVDDDAVLRKLFSRSIGKIAPAWTFRQASNGEMALRLVETGETFDLIFMDQYMASVEKQLLGTEAVAEMRSRGVTCRICGLSANDKEKEFFQAGADAFSFKPFPCEAAALKRELRRVLYSADGKERQRQRQRQ